MEIFLAAPFTEKIDPETQLINEEYRAWLTKIIIFLERKEHRVVNAHVREQWGRKLEPPGPALKHDFDSVKQTDVLVAHVEDPPSPGVQIEIGIALSFKKKIVVLCEINTRLPYLTKGLEALTDATIIRFVDIEDCLRQLAVVI